MVELWSPKPLMVVRIYHPVYLILNVNLVAQLVEHLAVNQRLLVQIRSKSQKKIFLGSSVGRAEA